MVLYRTKFKDKLHEIIQLGDILIDQATGLEYGVIFDLRLAEAVEDLKSGTVQKLTMDMVETMRIKERREDGPTGYP